MLTVGSIVIRVDDLERQKAFWTAALDYVPRDRGADDFVLLRPRSGIGPNISLDRHRAEQQIPPRIHLDLYSDNQAAEVERLLGLGATRVHWSRQPPDADYVIMADPEGNRFCVVARPSAFGFMAGRVEITGDIISPIDVDWDVDK